MSTTGEIHATHPGNTPDNPMNVNEQQTGTISWTGGRGKTVTREVNYVLDIRDFRGMPGFALLALAANTHLSYDVLQNWMAHEGVGRSRNYFARRRWLFSDPDAVNVTGASSNADGKDARALAVMRDNSSLSLRQLSDLLKRFGIHRGKDWIRRNRCR